MKTIKEILVLLVAYSLAIFILKLYIVESTKFRNGTVDITNSYIWVHRMIQAESNNRSEIVVLDSNSKLSFGCAQFQEETFMWQVKKFNLLPGAEIQEYKNMIRDCSFQRLLARTMVEHNPANIDHWRNTVKRIGTL